MDFLRSKFLLPASFSLFTIFLAIFTVQFFDNRSHERGSKARGPLTLKNPIPERIASTSHYWKGRLDVQPRWNHFLQSPEELLSETRWKPRNDAIFWKEFQQDLASIIEEKFPALVLSRKDLAKLTETIRTIQKSMLELGELERTGNQAEAIKKTHHQLNQALETFEEITEMNISEFILYGRPESGIDNEKPDFEEMDHEYIRDPSS